jgi:hypothetical protein
MELNYEEDEEKIAIENNDKVNDEVLLNYRMELEEEVIQENVLRF